MFENLTPAAVFCVIQVSLVAGLATCISSRQLTRRPVWAVSVCCCAILLNVLLTFTFPLPVPVLHVSLPEAIEVGRESLPSGASAEPDERTVPSEENDSPYFSATPNLLANSLASVQKALQTLADSSKGQVDGTMAKVCWFVAIAFSVLGLSRFIASCIGVFRLSREGDEILDFEVHALLATLVGSSQLRQKRDIRLLESYRLDCGAALGLWRPIIVLPKHWRDWSEEQLKSVLAHELAHLKRRDFLWRCMGCFVTSMHYFNPLVHMLSSRMQLAQELAADELAAEAIGRRVYLKSLSQLALGLETATTRNSFAGMTPVFSGHLIRRIKMLSQNRCGLRSEGSAFFRHIGMGCLLSVAVVGFFSKAFIQNASSLVVADEPTARLASLSKTRHDNGTKNLFGREKLNVDETIANRLGYMHWRVNDTLDALQLEAGGVTNMFNAVLSAELTKLMGAQHSVDLDLRGVESLHGEFLMQVRKVDPRNLDPNIDWTKQQKPRGRMVFGMNSTFLELKNEGDLAGWFGQNYPESEKFSLDEAECFVLPTIPNIGSMRVAVTQVGPKTVAATAATPFSKSDLEATHSEKLARILDSRVGQHRSGWLNAFQEVDGGIFSAVATRSEFDLSAARVIEEDFDKATPEERTAWKAVNRIYASFENVAIGFDVSADHQVLGMLVCVDAKTVDSCTEMLADLLVVRDHYRKELGEAKASDPISQMQLDLLQNVELEYSESGTSVLGQAEVKMPSIASFLFSALAASK